jgi:hypothetical protein
VGWEEFAVRLSGWETRLFSVVPVEDGFAAVGLTNKYVPPATVRAVRRGGSEVEVVVAEAGPFLAYCERAPRSVAVEGRELGPEEVEYSGHALRLDLGTAERPAGEVQIVLRW